MNGLLTDLYELTMAAGYYAASKHRDIATFEVAVRRLPRNRDWVVIAGVERSLEYLLGLSFTGDEIDYLRGVAPLKHAPEAFFEALRTFRFTGDVDAAPEGTVLLAGEPVLTVRAPIAEAQIPETYLLSAITFETLIATKAARIVDAAAGRPVLEFGTRRAHTPEAGTIGARAAFIGGCAGTSNTLSGFRYGIPVFGTSAHSWVMSFATETEAFRALQSMLREQTVQLIDTYDPIVGARHAADLGKPLWGVRIDSGDLHALSHEVRGILDAAGLREARVMVSGDLEENRIAELIASGAPIDAFGVGTELATSGDAPSMGMIYKMVELNDHGRLRYTAKQSAEKPSIPAAKQIWRFPGHDVIALRDERMEGGSALLEPMIRGGERVRAPETLAVIRDRAARMRAALDRDHAVERSPALEQVWQETVNERRVPDTQAFLDVDTQIDFLFPAGALYVPGAERIIPALARLNRFAAARGIALISTMCAHREDDPEFLEWGPHCVLGTVGQQKPAVLQVGQRFFEKQHTDIFRSPDADRMIAPFVEFVVYGVATEICVRQAAFGLLARGKRVTVVEDAVKELDGELASAFWTELRERGGSVRTSHQILAPE